MEATTTAASPEMHYYQQYETLLERARKVSGRNRFVDDLVAKSHRYELTPRQVDALRDALNRIETDDSIHWTPVEPGRQVIIGKVLSAKWRENQWGGCIKLLILDDRGHKLWGSCPSGLSWDGDCQSLYGRRLQLVASVDTSDDDQFFGFFKRPTHGHFIE